MSKRLSGNGSGLLPAVACSMILAGCAGYQLGTTLPPDIKSVHVPRFVNRTGEPLVENETTAATLQEIQRDGSLTIADAGRADTVLEVTLTRYRLEPLRYERDNVRTTREYRLRLTATLVFKRRGSNATLLERTVQGEATFLPQGDLTSAKRNALPEAARDLAHDIVESVVEYW